MQKARCGKIQKKITEDELVEIIESILGQEGQGNVKVTIKRVNRGGDDSDSDIDLDNLEAGE